MWNSLTSRAMCSAEFVAAVHGDLVNALAALGRFEEARGYAESAIEIGTRAWGAGHPQIQTFESLYAVVLFRTGDYEGCARVTREVLEARTRILGPDHIEVAETHFNLAMIEKAGGRLGPALEGLLATLPKFVGVYGWPHAKTEQGFKELELLGQQLAAAGDTKNAARAFRGLLELADDARVASAEWQRRAAGEPTLLGESE